MRVAIVYESIFGNTRLVAAAIAAGLRDVGPDVDVILTSTLETHPAQVAESDLVVLGAPTHAFRMSTPASRREAVHPKGGLRPKAPVEPGADGVGMRDVLDELPPAHSGQRFAAFDTRVRGPITGGASPGIARRLKRAGYISASPAVGFRVVGNTGPLVNGELERARAWGTSLVPATAGRLSDASPGT